MHSTNDSGDPVTPLPKKYSWYPNMQIESPMNRLVVESPKPKCISSFAKHNSIIVRNDPTTPQSVRMQVPDAGQLCFGKAMSAVKTKSSFGSAAVPMNKQSSVIPARVPAALGTGSQPNMSQPPQQKQNSTLFTVSDFDCDSFV